MEKDLEKYGELFDRYYDKDNIENVLMKLKEKGATQIISLMVLKKKLLLPLDEIDRIILNSKAWSEHKEDTLKLRDNLFEGFNQIIKDKEENSSNE